MKLLVLAQTPPPVHGQSLMVRTLVEGLPAHGIAVHHVNLPLSRDAADIGRWRIGKVVTTLVAALRAVLARFGHGCDTLYYVPAPAKRGALYRDWLLMSLCRPFFRRLVLHWHAVGLGEWLQTRATPLERGITRLLLGRADLSIVLADALRADAEQLHARTIACVPNGISDPGPETAPPASRPFRLLFLGLCSESKGLLSAAEAVLAANRRIRAPLSSPAFTLVAAGPFENLTVASRFRALIEEHSSILSYAGTVSGGEKAALFRDSHAFLFPTRYPAEGSPLVLLEALAHDRPILATRWRGIPEIVGDDAGLLVPPGDEEALVAGLLSLRTRAFAAGACRARFLALYTSTRHLATLATVLRAIPP